MRRTRVVSVLCAFVGLSFAPAAATTGAAAQELGPVFSCEPLPGDLVRNGGAEEGAAAPGRARQVPIPGWATTGGMTVLRYGDDGDLPGPASPGPRNRGSRFFSAGTASASEATASQTISLARYGRSIDRQRASVVMRACLGGSGERLDGATVSAEFLDDAGEAFAIGQIGPVSAWQRKETSGFRPQVLTGVIPPGTAAVKVTIRMPRKTSGFAYGVVDNVQLSVTERP